MGRVPGIYPRHPVASSEGERISNLLDNFRLNKRLLFVLNFV